jgi:FAD/FMN-containing dehydrogenase
MRGLGKEIPNTVPTVLRSNPFPAHPMLSRDGRRQLPMHGIFQYSRVAHFNNKYLKLLKDHEVKMSAYGVSQVAVYAGISTNGILFEPVLIWPDTVEEFHRRHTSDDILANVQATEANEPARALVSDLHAKILDLMYECGGVHLQIGKAYPYLRDRDATQKQMLKNLKALTDPKDLFNPGALGLGVS